jgi:hypothetical protein
LIHPILKVDALGQSLSLQLSRQLRSNRGRMPQTLDFSGAVRRRPHDDGCGHGCCFANSALRAVFRFQQTLA